MKPLPGLQGKLKTPLLGPDPVSKTNFQSLKTEINYETHTYPCSPRASGCRHCGFRRRAGSCRPSGLRLLRRHRGLRGSLLLLLGLGWDARSKERASSPT